MTLGVERTSLPAFVKPQSGALVKKTPDGPDWLDEIKLDRYRMHARLDAGRVKIITWRGDDRIAQAIARLPAQNAYLDGELCGVLPDGRTAFNLIQNAADTGEEITGLFFCSTCCSWMAGTFATCRWRAARSHSASSNYPRRIRRLRVTILGYIQHFLTGATRQQSNEIIAAANRWDLSKRCAAARLFVGSLASASTVRRRVEFRGDFECRTRPQRS
jgi:hypothetical protein